MFIAGASDLPKAPTYGLEPGHPTPGWPTLLRPPIAQTPTGWYRNINLFPITYASQPRLRDRLTLRGLPLLRKPEAYGVLVSRQHYRYSCLHDLFHLVQVSSRSPFTLQWNAPLPFRLTAKSVASVMCLAPLHFRRRTARPVSYYAFFKGWLLLSQPPGCLSVSTSFPT